MPYLPSFRNYNDLNKSYYRAHGYDNKCQDLQDKLSDYVDIEELCHSFSGIFKKYSDFKTNILFDDNVCSLVNYWLYDRVFNVIIHRKNKKNVEEIIFNILKFWGYFIKSHKCNIQLEYCIQDNFEKAKKLYDFATNYHTIENYLKTPGYICTEKFSKYITENIDSYKQIEGECSNSTKIYCKLLKDIYTKYGKDNLLQLKCDNVQSISNSPSLQHQEGDTYQSFALSGTGDYTSSSSNTAVASILPLLGISFTTFFLYKFTSIGTWINPKIGSIKKVIKNLYEDNDKSINNSENIDIDFENQEVNMQYHSWGNY
ncbi:PIR protein [Plasmodium ovale]|uniref:PIR protein n=1 Tax=Plasmodium ovale TaxID=36330 RepID=A0A1D3JEC2_PLAOA|nr:PIR protein [Plasmodium ovale]